MKLVIEDRKFKKGGNEGSISYHPQNEGTAFRPFLAVTATKSGWYKTQKGAENFMARNGYIEVIEEIEIAAAAEEVVEQEPVDEVLEAINNIVPTASLNNSILTDRKDIAKALNFGKYPVLQYDLDEEKGGSKARVIKESRNNGPIPYRCQLYMGSQTRNDGVFYLMTKASMLKGNVGVYDYIEDAEFANAPVIESNQEVAILVHSRARGISFVLIAKSSKVDPTYSSATTFKY